MNRILTILKKYESIAKKGNVIAKDNAFYTEDRILIGKVLP